MRRFTHIEQACGNLAKYTHALLADFDRRLGTQPTTTTPTVLYKVQVVLGSAEMWQVPVSIPNPTVESKDFFTPGLVIGLRLKNARLAPVRLFLGDRELDPSTPLSVVGIDPEKDTLRAQYADQEPLSFVCPHCGLRSGDSGSLSAHIASLHPS